MTAPRRRDPDAKRAALHAAATRLFARDGYDATSISGIARAAGMAVGTVYRFHPNKAALLRGLQTDLEAEFVDAMTADWRAGGSYGDRLDRMAAGLVRLMAERAETLGVLAQTGEAPGGGPRAGDALRAAIRAQVEEAQAAGAFHPGDPALHAAVAHGMVEGAMRRFLADGARDPEGTAKAVAALLRRAYLVEGSGTGS